LSQLTASGRLVRLEKGKYLFVPEGFEENWAGNSLLIASHLAKPYAIAYWSALNYWQYTEQVPSTVFIQTTRRKLHNEIKIQGVTYKFIFIKKNKYFANETIWEKHHKILVTSREKTIVDCFDAPQYSGGLIETAKAVTQGIENKELNMNKIVLYGEKLGNTTIFKRLGYLMEALKLDVPAGIIAKIQEKVGKGYSKLDPTLKTSGKFNKKWQIIVNIPEESLIDWRRT